MGSEVVLGGSHGSRGYGCHRPSTGGYRTLGCWPSGCVLPPLAGRSHIPTRSSRERSGGDTCGYSSGTMNLHLNRFWTLVVVCIGAPLLAILLFWETLFVMVLLGWDSEI
jgi:hypothetical protein